MPETRTFSFSWHYRWVILPIIWLCITAYLISLLVQYAGILLNGQGISFWDTLSDFPIVLVCFFVSYKWLTMPLSVVIDGTGKITLRGFLRRSKIAAADITQIERWIMWERIYAQGKKFYVSTLMQKNNEIIPALRAHNPFIETFSRYQPRDKAN